jgi:hypothetical protein
MKGSPFTFLALTLFLALTHGYTDVTSVYECEYCIKTLGNFVCRDTTSLTLGFCCSPTETSRACTGRDFCSSQAKTLAMQMTACPFVQRTCSGSQQQMILRPNQTYSIVHSQ